MKYISRFIFISLFVFAAVVLFGQDDFRKTAPKAGAAPKIDLGDYESFTLDNGLQVIVVENHKLPRISFQLLVDAPPLLEGKYAGAASMAGELMRTGTTSRTKAQIDEAVDFIGASFNTSASGLYAAALTKHKDELLNIVSDVLLNPTFPEDELEKLRKQTLSSLAQAKEDPNAIAANVAQVLRYGKEHPYGEMVTEETVKNITVEQVKAYYTTYFKPNISYLAIVGDITPSEAKTIAEKYFGNWQKGEAPKSELPKVPQPKSTEVAFVDKTGAVQSIINITYPVELQPGAPDAIKASLMNSLLGGYFGSRINQNLREDKAYTYGANTTLSTDPYVGYFSARASVRNEVTDSSIVQFLHELNRLQDEKVPADELELVKNVRTGSFARSLENPQTIANFALNIARYNLPEDYYATYLQKLNAVTADELQEMAKKYILPQQAHILVVGNKDEVAGKLVQFDADKELTYYDAFGNVVDMSEVDIPTDMTAEQVIQKYVDALGGKDKLKAIKSQKTVMSAETPMGAIAMTIVQKAPNMFYQAVNAGGMMVMETKFSGEAGMMVQMGQQQKIEGEGLEQMKMQARMFPEANWESLGYTATLKGAENVNGENAYRIEVETASGQKYTDYFDMDTFLKIRTIATADGQTVTNDYSDYKEVDGIKIPYTMVVSGAMPFPLQMKVTEVTFNGDVADDMFKVN